jgi:hypothetical protein
MANIRVPWRDRKAWAIAVLIVVVVAIPIGYYLNQFLQANGDATCALV